VSTIEIIGRLLICFILFGTGIGIIRANLNTSHADLEKARNNNEEWPG
jgi:hypothetical protein